MTIVSAPTPYNITLLTLVFPPDGVSTAQLVGDLTADLDRAGHRVRVITTTPHYNVDVEARAAQPIRWPLHRLVGRSTFGGADVLHIRMPSKASSRALRGLQWLWFHLLSIPLLVIGRDQTDVVLCVTPPPTVALVARLHRRLTGRPFILALWELYPEILVKLDKVQRGSSLHRTLQWLEKRTYERADSIAVLHDDMARAVQTTIPGQASRVHVVPTCADTEFLVPGHRMNDFRTELGIGDEFVIGYAGNLGVSQDLTPLLEAAELLKDDQRFSFVIAGDGSERQRLADLVAQRKLDNVLFTGQLPYRRMPEVTASFDLAVVALAVGVDAEALPSKVYRLMSCGRPILAIAEDGGPLVRLVQQLGVGLTASPLDAKSVAEAIRNVADDEDERREMGRRARTAAVNQFSRQAVTARYESLLAAAVTSTSR